MYSIDMMYYLDLKENYNCLQRTVIYKYSADCFIIDKLEN